MQGKLRENQGVITVIYNVYPAGIMVKKLVKNSIRCALSIKTTVDYERGGARTVRPTVCYAHFGWENHVRTKPESAGKSQSDQGDTPH